MVNILRIGGIALFGAGMVMNFVITVIAPSSGLRVVFFLLGIIGLAMDTIGMAFASAKQEPMDTSENVHSDFNANI